MNNKGFTLIEIIVVIAILAILSAIAIPRIADYKDVAKKQVCYSNCKTIERTYEIYLEREGLDHRELLFNQYMIDNEYNPCPEDGIVSYIDGKVYCSIHNPIEESEEEEEEVPFL